MHTKSLVETNLAETTATEPLVKLALYLCIILH